MHIRRSVGVLGAGFLTLGLLATGTAQAGATPVGTAAPGRSGLAPLTASTAARLSRRVDEQVIVVMRDQHRSLADTRAGAARRQMVLGAEQAPIVSDLRRTGSRGIHPLQLLNGVVATVSAGEARRLKSDPAVAEVVANQTVVLGPAPTLLATARAASPRRTATKSSTACQEGPGGVELDPEALSVIHAASTNPNEPTARRLGFSGTGVTVGFMAEQVNVDEPGFVRRNGTHVFTDYRDFTGEGPTTGTFGGEAILDASSIAAQGNQVFQLGSCTFRVEGVAPGASLVGIKVFPEGALTATTSALLEGINYAVSHDHVNVLNESFGYNPLPDTARDLIRQADEAAVRAGTVVVVSSGDAGPTQTIGSPSTAPGVISVGATTTFRAYAQADIANYHQIGAKGWVNGNMSALSSSGVAEDLKSPDVVAPGDLNWTLANYQPGSYGAGISGGTSEAAPLTAGVAALVIQAYRSDHGGATPPPALVKRIITSTATDLGHPGYEQGTGLLNAYQAVEAALSVHTAAGAPRHHGETLLESRDQLRGVGLPGARKAFGLTVTNTGQDTQTVRLAGRVLSAYAPLVTRTVTLGAHVGRHFNGLDARFVTFRVPRGISRLDAAVAAPTKDYSMDLTLLDPAHRLVAYSLPQGYANHGDDQVAFPAAGTWTAVVTDYPGSQGGYSGPVRFEASVARYQSFGTAIPGTMTLRPGASRTVAFVASTPSSPGDLSAALTVHSSGGVHGALPIALRSLVPLRRGSGTFSDTVTGGNGRGGAPAATAFYQFDVPKGKRALDVQTLESTSALDPYDLYLVDPEGETVGHSSNQSVVGASASGLRTATRPGARAHVLWPAAGRWTLVVAFSNPVKGTALQSALRGVVSFAEVRPRTAGLPRSPSTRLPDGTAHLVRITVRNNGPAPEAYFVDARFHYSTTLSLRSITPSANLTLPLAVSGTTPQWIVPTETTRLLATAASTAPVTFDWAPYTGNIGGALNGDPDLGAVRSATGASTTWSHTPVTPGDWEIDPALVGPFASAAPAAKVTLSMRATTKAFDRSVRSTTGDFWAREAGQSSQSFRPVIVRPGQTATIYVTITPKAKSGSVVHGTLFLDDASSLSPFGQAVPSGQELASMPFAYTVSGG